MERPELPEPERPAVPSGRHVDLSERILSASATMVGVCLTVIGIVRVSVVLRKVESVTDNLVAFEAVAFLGACLLSYASIRATDRRHKLNFERVADFLFLAALIGMVGVCGLLAYEIV